MFRLKKNHWSKRTSAKSTGWAINIEKTRFLLLLYSRMQENRTKTIVRSEQHSKIKKHAYWMLWSWKKSLCREINIISRVSYRSVDYFLFTYSVGVPVVFTRLHTIILHILHKCNNLWYNTFVILIRYFCDTVVFPAHCVLLLLFFTFSYFAFFYPH